MTIKIHVRKPQIKNLVNRLFLEMKNIENDTFEYIKTKKYPQINQNLKCQKLKYDPVKHTKTRSPRRSALVN